MVYTRKDFFTLLPDDGAVLALKNLGFRPWADAAHMLTYCGGTGVQCEPFPLPRLTTQKRAPQATNLSDLMFFRTSSGMGGRCDSLCVRRQSFCGNANLDFYSDLVWIAGRTMQRHG